MTRPLCRAEQLGERGRRARRAGMLTYCRWDYVAGHFLIITVRRLGRLLDLLDLTALTGGRQRLASEHRGR